MAELNLEQPHFETLRAPIVARTAVFSPLNHHNAEWSLRRALNVVASLALLLTLTLLGLRRRG